MILAQAGPNSNSTELAQKEWRRPELRKLPIEATSGSTSKGGPNNADGTSTPKNADASGQVS